MTEYRERIANVPRVTVSFNIGGTKHKALHLYAKKHNMSDSELIRRAIAA